MISTMDETLALPRMRRPSKKSEKTSLIRRRDATISSGWARLLVSLLLIGALSIFVHLAAKNYYNRESRISYSSYQSQLINHAQRKDALDAANMHINDPGAPTQIKWDSKILGVSEIRQEDVSFHVYNSYTAEKPLTWSPWNHVAEPHRLTYFESVCVGEPCILPGAIYTWRIISISDGSSKVLNGATSTNFFTAVGKYTIKLTIRYNGKRVEISDELMVKYVRREIRDLTNDDRETFLNAMETLYRLPQQEGELKYGLHYVSAAQFVAVHLSGAGMKECDSWHDGASILIKHTAITLAFEQALQVIDPSIAIPYWEYTIDSYIYKGHLEKSPIFNENLFGSMNPDELNHSVNIGRWAYTPIQTDAWDKVHNPFGLLRSPWNTDSTPFLRRHSLVNGSVGFFLPTCETFSGCYREESISGINNCLNGAAHGPVHILVGGEWGHSNEDFVQTWGIAGKLVLIMKALWRRGYVRIPEKCTAGEACRSYCPPDVYEYYGKTPYDVLLESKALEWIAPTSRGMLYLDYNTGQYRISGLDEGSKEESTIFLSILEALCDPGYVGEMFTSGSPSDPTFWVIHQSAERLLGLKRLLDVPASSGTSFDETWGYAYRNDVGAMDVVCDWSNVKEFVDLPECNVGVCPGHGAYDDLPFVLRLGNSYRKMSNTEFYDFIHPWNEELPYMYDSYSWPHCEEQGIIFGKTGPHPGPH